MARKVSKAEIRRNELLELLKELVGYVQERLIKVTIVGVILLVLVVIIPSSIYYKKHVDLKAASLLDNGIAYYEKARLSGDNSAYEQSQGAFSRVISDYALSSSTPMALLYMGNTFYQLGNFSEAKRAYLRFMKKYPNQTLTGLAQRGVATATEMVHDYDNAVIEYQKLVDGYSEFVTDDIRLNQARCYEELQRFDEAIAIYTEMGPNNLIAKLRLKILNNKKKV